MYNFHIHEVMKKYVLLFLMLIGVLGFECMAQYQVNHLRTSGETMTFRVVGYGKNAKKASADAEIQVMKAIIFHGVPDSQQSVPMVSETESASYSAHKNFWNVFWNGDYQRLISRSVIVRKFGKDENKQKSIALEVTVNVRALRQELERNGVIRKFGL